MGNPHAIVYVEDTDSLDLAKIGEAGYAPADWEETLKTYVQKELG